MGLTESRKTVKKNQPFGVKLTNFDRYSKKKKLTVKRKNSNDNNEVILTVRRKMTKILTVSRKSYHSTETPLKVSYFSTGKATFAAKC